MFNNLEMHFHHEFMLSGFDHKYPSWNRVDIGLSDTELPNLDKGRTFTQLNIAVALPFSADLQ